MRESSRTGAILYLILLALHIALVWRLPFFPSQDGPSHLYNLVILHDLLNGGREWGAFFSSDLRPVPNLGFHIIAYPLISLFAPLVVEKLFVSLYIVFMGIAVPVFLHSFDRPIFPLSYFVFPVVFNFTLLMGFYSYAIAVPLFLIAFSLSWEQRTATPLLRFVYLNMAGIVLFYFHLIPFCLFLIALAITALVETTGWKKKIAALVKLTVTISPLLLLYFLYETSASKGYHLSFSYLASLSRFIDLTEHLFFFSMDSLSRTQIIPAALVQFVFLFFLAVYGIEAWRTGRDDRGGAVRIPVSGKTLLAVALLFVVIYYGAPFRLGEGSYFNQRFPWVIFLMLLPLLRIPEGAVSGRFATLLILCAVIPLFYCNAVVMERQSAKIGEFLSGLDLHMKRGTFAMGYKTKYPQWSDIDVLMHAASYYGIYKGVVDAGDYEAGLPYFPVRFRKDLPPLPSQDTIAYDPARIRWPLYPHIRYLFAWDLEQQEREPLERVFRIIRERGRLSIWERNGSLAGVPSSGSMLQ